MSWDILSKANLQYLLTRLKVVTDSITRGHAIKNSSGSSMTQRNGLEFSDAHVSDDSTNDKTIVDVIKETSNISNETEEGFYFDTSKPEAVINAKQVAFDKTGTSYTSDDIDGVLNEVDNRTKVKTVLEIPANTYNTWGEALTILGNAFDNLTQVEKENAYLVWNDKLIYSIQDLASANKTFTWIQAGLNSLSARSMFIASTPYYMIATISTSYSAINATSNAQGEKIVLKTVG